jgi:hypothetical protein
MWLTYGVDRDQQLVSIDAAPRGKTALTCPYCGGALTAKKGRIKEHHFAHTGATCRAVERDDAVLALPLYDNFNLRLPGAQLQALRELWETYGQHNWPVPSSPVAQTLAAQDLLRWNSFRGRCLQGGYEFTKLGKIPVGALSLHLFNQVQEPLLLHKLAELEAAAQEAHAQGLPALAERLVDLRIYRRQLQRIVATTLYLLEVRADGEVLYKIGVTSRAVEERVAEIQQQLRAYFAEVAITVVGAWPHRGNVELYFKHRYHAYQRPVGVLTEFFTFDDSAAVVRDVRRMQPKQLTAVEQEVLAGKPSPIEELIAAERQAQQRAAAIRQGMQAAAAQGVHVGRPAGSAAPDAFLAKPTSQRVIAALDQGLSVRKAAQAANVAINTVRKVAAARQQAPAPDTHQ